MNRSLTIRAGRESTYNARSERIKNGEIDPALYPARIGLIMRPMGSIFTISKANALDVRKLKAYAGGCIIHDCFPAAVRCTAKINSYLDPSC